VFKALLATVWAVWLEIDAWLDSKLPFKKARGSFRRWRRTRPFWGGALVIEGGAIIPLVPLAPLSIMVHVGMAAVSGVAIGMILIVAGLFFWFAPQQRMFIAIVTTICSLASFVTSNLGGLGFGMLLGLIGSSMAFGWRPHPESKEGRRHAARTRRRANRLNPLRTPEQPADWDEQPAAITEILDPVPLDAPDHAPQPEHAPEPDHVPELDRVPEPEHAAGSAPNPVRNQRRLGGGLAVVVLIIVSGLLILAPRGPAPLGPAPAVAADPCPTPSPTPPGLIPSWLLPPWLQPIPAAPCPSTSAAPRAPTIPGVPGAGTPAPGATPTPSGSPLPSPSGTPPPKAAAGSAAGPSLFGPNVPEVSADTLEATGFTFKGSIDMPSVRGPIHALIFHADRIVAKNYTLRTGDNGSAVKLSVDLDIDNVTIYATRLGGTITVPYLNIPLIPITITADLIPTWLKLNIWLPVFSGNDIQAGQVYIDAATVKASNLAAHVSTSV
jgi:hypothetical protein